MAVAMQMLWYRVRLPFWFHLITLGWGALKFGCPKHVHFQLLGFTLEFKDKPACKGGTVNGKGANQRKGQ